jgi:AcrR family transcriptional regulator
VRTPSSRRALVRTEILTTAAELFRVRGFRAATLDDLARRLGMSKATVYGYFRSKEDLLAAIFHRTATLADAGLTAIRASGLSPAEQLREVIRHHVRLVVAERAFLAVFFSEESSLPARLQRNIARRKARYDRTVRAIVERAACAGEIRTPEPRLLVLALLGMSNWVYRWYRPGRGRGWDADTIAEAFIDLVERGYLATPAARGREVGRRLARLEAEVRALRPLLRGIPRT